MPRDDTPTSMVFDAGPLVAFFAGEPGAEVTRDALRPILAGETDGYLNEVNAAEVWYIIKRHAGPEAADDHLAWLQHEARLRLVSSEETWRRAALFKADHRMSLGDAFAMATAYQKDCPVLTGNDKESLAGERIGVDVRRIRTIG